MAIDSQAFKDTLAQWSSGVTVVTTHVDNQWFGLTVSSFASVSLEPPLISVCLAKRLYTHSVLEQSGVLAVNILSSAQVEWGKLFAGFFPEVKDRFAEINCRTAVTGCPILPGTVAWLDCQVYNTCDAGDHTIFLGEVVASGHDAAAGPPLVYHNRQWGEFTGLKSQQR